MSDRIPYGTRAWIVKRPTTEHEVDLGGIEVEVVGPGGMVGEYTVRVIEIDEVRQRWIDHPGGAGPFDAYSMGVSADDFAAGRLRWEYCREDLEPEDGPNTAPCLVCDRRIPFGNVDDEGRCDRCQS